MSGRRIVRVALPYLEQMVRGDFPGITSTAPADLRVLEVRQEASLMRAGEVVFLCESDTWPENEPGTGYPEETPTYTRIDEKESA